MKFLTKIFGTRNDKIIKELKPLVHRINQLEASLKPLSDEALRLKTKEYQERISRGESLDSLLPEAFATCRETAARVLNQRHFDVQLIGGIVLHQGRIAEMKTGEGKTLTATLPSYLHGLTGNGSHVVTVNDYLAERDAEWMGRIYQALGLSVGIIKHGLSDKQRQQAYAADITYGTNNEFGFDYLRDNMKNDPTRLVQRGFHFGIVDEVDSILIDEARTPLIISGPSETNVKLYHIVNTAIPGLQKDSDYILDEKNRSVSLTEDGISKLEKRLGIANLYDPSHIEYLHHSQQALKAHTVFKKDVDYVVRNSEIVIVDEFTGRLMPGRRYSDGLHGALEAKEHVEVQQETQTLATITFQNFFRLYDTLSGMTGTADTEAVEFKKIYNLDVVVIPTNQIVVREDLEDVIYRTSIEKYNAIAEEITQAQAKGQPVLVGTVSVEKSELLSNLLKRRKIPHEILNAKNHANEAKIISEAGEKGSVVISTNMAGRGTDIKLGAGVRELGGLYVMGTERHESRRIDNQLRGRAGRQGDPGKSKFFLSLEDDLMRIFASDRLSNIMARLGMEEGEAIFSPMVTRAIEKAQRRVEEHNFSSRKHVLEYDDVMSQQRQVVYKKRRQALLGELQVDFFDETLHAIVDNIISQNSPQTINSETWDFDAIKIALKLHFKHNFDFSSFDPSMTKQDILVDKLLDQVMTAYHQEKLLELGEENLRRLENFIFLQKIDRVWKDHLLAMDNLKDSVSLRGYAQRDPLQEYKKEAFVLFENMMNSLSEDVALTLVNLAKIEQNETLDSQEETEETSPQLNKPLSLPSPTEVKDDKLIYHGSRSDTQKQAAQTYKREHEKVGRNDTCPCGSGKKYKKCHGLA